MILLYKIKYTTVNTKNRTNMIFITQDITKITKGLIGHVVNCQHAMGSGVARSIRDQWPIVYDQFMTRPKGEVMLGRCDIVMVNDSISVANLYGQLHFGNDGARYGSLAAIETALMDMFHYATSMQLLDVYLPKIGSLRAGLDWDTEVLPLLERVLLLYPEVNLTICIHGE